MLRDAFQEIRQHPGRFVATIIAIALGVGFLTAISVSVATGERAVSTLSAKAASKADLVVSGGSLEQVKGVDGVAEAYVASEEMISLSREGKQAFATVYTDPPQRMRWVSLKQGTWPESDDEIVLDPDAINKLDAEIGQQVAADGSELTIVGISSDSVSIFGNVAYWTRTTDYSSTIMVAVDGNVSTVQQEISSLPDVDSVETGAEHVEDADPLSEVDVFKYILYGFGGLAVVVSIIIIGNTLNILVTQRRRQIGLLRAVGASTGQVRGRLVAEALMLGALGSVLGVVLGIALSAAVAAWIGILDVGLQFSWGELAVAVAVGLVATFIAVLGPSLAATRIPPLEALNPVPSAAEEKRIGTFRWIVVIGSFVLSALLLIMSYLDDNLALVWAMGGAALLSLGALYGAPIYIAPLIRLVGKPLSALGPTTRLAVLNAARNPRRTASTAVALMLAVGITITLQVMVSTARTTGGDAITEHYPIDLIVKPGRDAEAMINDLVNIEGVDQAAAVPAKYTSSNNYVFSSNDVVTQWQLPSRLVAADGSVVAAGTIDDLPSAGGGTLEPEVTFDQALERNVVLAAPDVYAQVDGDELQTVWVKFSRDAGFDTLMDLIPALMTAEFIGGNGGSVLILNAVLGMIMVILTVLVGVAVLIALVGVANTLGLSVLERQRESALLRALGMQKKDLRIMMLIEALTIAGIALVIGIAAGAFFGWLSVDSTLRTITAASQGEVTMQPHFSVDLPLTLGLLVICVVAAALASFMPGLKASRATPAEALAAE